MKQEDIPAIMDIIKRIIAKRPEQAHCYQAVVCNNNIHIHIFEDCNGELKPTGWRIIKKEFTNAEIKDNLFALRQQVRQDRIRKI